MLAVGVLLLALATVALARFLVISLVAPVVSGGGGGKRAPKREGAA
jgi:hypothetical protein